MQRTYRALISLIITFLLSCFPLLGAPPVNRAAVLDFDGDGKTDSCVVRFEVLSAEIKWVWYIRGSQRGDAGSAGADEPRHRAGQPADLALGRGLPGPRPLRHAIVVASATHISFVSICGSHSGTPRVG